MGGVAAGGHVEGVVDPAHPADAEGADHAGPHQGPALRMDQDLVRHLGRRPRALEAQEGHGPPGGDLAPPDLVGDGGLGLLGHEQALLHPAHVERQAVQVADGDRPPLGVVGRLAAELRELLVGLLGPALQAGQLSGQQRGVEAGSGFDGHGRQLLGQGEVIPPPGRRGRGQHAVGLRPSALQPPGGDAQHVLPAAGAH